MSSPPPPSEHQQEGLFDGLRPRAPAGRTEATPRPRKTARETARPPSLEVLGAIRNCKNIVRSAWHRKAPNGPTMQDVRLVEDYLKSLEAGQ